MVNEQTKSPSWVKHAQQCCDVEDVSQTLHWPGQVSSSRVLLRGSRIPQADVADVDPLEVPQASAAEMAMLADWRSNLAALASCMASPADEALIVRLGDRLWEQQGQVCWPELRCLQVIALMPSMKDKSLKEGSRSGLL